MKKIPAGIQPPFSRGLNLEDNTTKVLQVFQEGGIKLFRLLEREGVKKIKA